MERGQRITVCVQYDFTTRTIGNIQRPKSDFMNLKKFMEEVRVAFGVAMHPECSYELHYRCGPGFCRKNIGSDGDLQKAVAENKNKKLLINVGRVTSLNDSSFSEWKTRMETEVQALRESHAKLRLQLDNHRSRCPENQLSLLYTPTGQELLPQKNEDETERPSTSSLEGGVIKSEGEPLLDCLD